MRCIVNEAALRQQTRFESYSLSHPTVRIEILVRIFILQRGDITEREEAQNVDKMLHNSQLLGG